MVRRWGTLVRPAPRIVEATAPGASVLVRYWRGLKHAGSPGTGRLDGREIEPPQRTVRAARSGSLFDRLGLAVGEATGDAAPGSQDQRWRGGAKIARSGGAREIEPGDVIEAVVLRGSVSVSRVEPVQAAD